jgi:hypothetical protein
MSQSTKVIDMESGGGIIMASIVPPVVVQGYANTNDINENVAENNTKLCYCIFIIIFTFPLIFCDLYYASKYHECLKQTNYSMEISMYSYLVTTAIFSILNVLLIIFIIITFNHLQTRNLLDLDNCLFKLFGKINIIFNILWTLCGVIIFWVYLNQRECSHSVDDYLKISLIIKILLLFTNMITNICTKNN